MNKTTLIPVLVGMVTTLIGLSCGFILQFRLHIIKQRENALYLLQEIKREFEHNINLFNQLSEESKRISIGKEKAERLIHIPSCHLEFRIWKNSRLPELRCLVDKELISRISHIYYENEHLQRKIDKLFDSLLIPPSKDPDINQRIFYTRKILSQAILSHIQKENNGLLLETKNAIESINNLLLQYPNYVAKKDSKPKKERRLLKLP